MGLLNRWRAAKRKSELRYLIATSRMTYVGWAQEIAYIERTGRTDWVDPNIPPIRPAGSSFGPPMPR
jgi:hypothetical protein